MNASYDLSSAVEIGSPEYFTLLNESGHTLPVTYPPAARMALAYETCVVTDWIPLTSKFMGGANPVPVNRVYVRIAGSVRFWHRLPSSTIIPGATFTVTFPAKLWTASPDVEQYVPSSSFSGFKFEFGYSLFDGSSYSNSGELLRVALPNLWVHSPPVPCGCDDQYDWKLQYAIIHLNDQHKWSREKIADWLDTLDIDLSFPIPDTIPSEIH